MHACWLIMLCCFAMLFRARFSSLAWGRAGASAGRSYGLIAGGLSDGVVEIFDPSKIIQRTEGTSVATVKQHTGAIKSVHFNGNPGSTHLFAAGSRCVPVERQPSDSTAQPTSHLAPAPCAVTAVSAS